MRRLFIVLVLCLLVGCGGNGNTPESANNNSNNDKNQVEEPTDNGEGVKEESGVPFDVDGKKEFLDVGVEKFNFSITPKEPDSIGVTYGDFIFTNHSEYPVTSMNLTLKRLDTGEITYATYNLSAVMPGEESLVLEVMLAEEDGSTEYEILKYDYILSKDNLNYAVSYDPKIEKYETIVYE